MKITAKAIDVNDIFADVSRAAATIISSTFATVLYCKCTGDGSSSYRNVCRNVVYVYCFASYFHYQAIQHFYFSLLCDEM